MYLQGNLQVVFDALYEMGVIEPVLKMDWQSALNDMTHDRSMLQRVIQLINDTNHDDAAELAEKLETFDEKTLSYLAMEVAREYADFHSRDEVH